MTQHHESDHSSGQPSGQPFASPRKLVRQSLLALRNATPLATRQQWDRGLSKKLLAWCTHQQLSSLGIYWPSNAEPDISECYATLHQRGIQLALPVVIGKALPLQFVAWQPGDAMVVDAYGIPVPLQRNAVMLPEVLLIPCVGFNRDLFRLGYGGGFYDRTLALDGRPLAVGIAYQIGLAEFASEPHDVAMDMILTESVY